MEVEDGAHEDLHELKRHGGPSIFITSDLLPDVGEETLVFFRAVGLDESHSEEEP